MVQIVPMGSLYEIRQKLEEDILQLTARFDKDL
jgi:hypothetical protein